MRKALVSILLAVLLSASGRAAIELRSADEPADHPFGMVEFAAPDGVNKDQWRQIKADILAELPKLTKCQANLDECTSTNRKFAEIVKEAESQEGLAKIALINAVINALIDYEPDRNQWGVADQVDRALRQQKRRFRNRSWRLRGLRPRQIRGPPASRVRSEDVRMVLVHDYAVRADHAILAVRYDKRWLILDNRWDKLVEDNELKQFKPLAIIDASWRYIAGQTIHLE